MSHLDLLRDAYAYASRLDPVSRLLFIKQLISDLIFSLPDFVRDPPPLVFINVDNLISIIFNLEANLGGLIYELEGLKNE